MTQLAAIDDLDAFARTRTSWQTLAEHVLAKARWLSDGRIGLRAAPGGVATPPFGSGEHVAIDGTTIVRSRNGTQIAAAAITTLRAAGDFAGVEPGAPEGVYTPTTKPVLDEPLLVDETAAARLADWFAFGARVLEGWRADHEEGPGAPPSLVQLWPEHFDIAVDLGDADAGRRANYGASPGDAAIPEPYLYVGPWVTERIGTAGDGFWNQPWGAALRYRELAAAPDPVAAAQAFLAHGELRLA